MEIISPKLIFWGDAPVMNKVFALSAKVVFPVPLFQLTEVLFHIASEDPVQVKSGVNVFKSV